MKFVKVIYVYDSGMIKERWLNLNHIHSVYPTDYYNSKDDKTYNNVLGLETPSEVPAYIDLNKPIEIKALDEFATDFIVKEPPKRGRPPKHDKSTGQSNHR